METGIDSHDSKYFGLDSTSVVSSALHNEGQLLPFELSSLPLRHNKFTVIFYDNK